MTETDPLYAKAETLRKHIRSDGPLSREKYETLAAEYGVPVKPDEELPLPFGVYNYPEYEIERLPRLWIEQLRRVAVDREREERRAATRAAKLEQDKADKIRLRNMPVIRTEKRLSPGHAPQEWLRDGLLYSVIERARHRIDESDPSLYGEHLLGHEGEWGQFLTIEVRGAEDQT